MNDPKPLFLSKTVWGAILAAVGYFIARLQAGIPTTTAEWIALVMEALGILLIPTGIRDKLNKI